MAKRVSWKHLQLASGPATRIPKLVDALLGDEPVRREEALAILRDVLVGQNQWFTASPSAVSLLLESLPNASRPDFVLALVADVLGADHLRAWLNPPIEVELDPDTVSAALDHKAELLASARSDYASARSGAALVLSMLPSLCEETLPILKTVATDDPDASARASALLALARLATDDKEVPDIVASSREVNVPLIRGAAALAWLRLEKAHGFEEVAPELETGLSWEPGGETPLPWFGAFSPHVWFRGLRLPDSLPRALVELARSRGKDGENQLLDLTFQMCQQSANGNVQTQLAKIVLALGGFEAGGEIVEANRLSDRQRNVAERLAHTWLVPGGGYGLPAAGAARRRWIGIDPPSALEHRVEVDGEECSLRIAWLTRFETFGLSKVEFWEALVDYVSMSYPPKTWAMKPDDVENELAKVSGDLLLDVATRTADDLAERFRAAERCGHPLLANFQTSALLFLPLVRAGRPIEPRWDLLFYIGGEPQARELLRALPADRREQRVISYLEPDRAVWAHVKNVLEVADLVPTKRVGRLLAQKIADLEAGNLRQQDLERLKSRFDELMHTSPSMAG